jgi:hypothetical protein
MKKNLFIYFLILNSFLTKAQTLEINVFGLYNKPQTKINTSGDVITQGSIYSKRVGKGIEIKLALIKNAYIGITYQDEKTITGLSNHEYNSSYFGTTINTKILGLGVYNKSKYYGINYHYYLRLKLDSVHKFRLNLVPQLEIGWNHMEEYGVSVTMPSNDPNDPNAYIEITTRQIAPPFNKKLRLQGGIGIQASYDQLNLIAGYRYGLTQWDSKNGYLYGNYLPISFSRMQILVRHSYFYFGIGYVLAPFSKKTIF